MDVSSQSRKEGRAKVGATLPSLLEYRFLHPLSIICVHAHEPFLFMPPYILLLRGQTQEKKANAKAFTIWILRSAESLKTGTQTPFSSRNSFVAFLALSLLDTCSYRQKGVSPCPYWTHVLTGRKGFHHVEATVAAPSRASHHGLHSQRHARRNPRQLHFVGLVLQLPSHLLRLRLLLHIRQCNNLRVSLRVALR